MDAHTQLLILKEEEKKIEEEEKRVKEEEDRGEEDAGNSGLTFPLY